MPALAATDPPMACQLGIFACGNLAGEVRACVQAEGWTDVTVAEFPARCGRPQLAWEEVRRQLPADCAGLVLLGGACLQAPPPADLPPLRVLAPEPCLALVADEALVAEAVAGGAYLATPGWLAHWPERLAELGLGPETAPALFQDFCRELVLLDTGIDPAAEAQLGACAAATGLPARRVAVGLAPLRNRLGRAAAELRLAHERQARAEAEREHARERADLTMAMHQLARLGRIGQEDAAVTAIGELFQMLFAPGDWRYLPVGRGLEVGSPGLPDALLTEVLTQPPGYAWTPSGAGFLLRLEQAGTPMAILVVDQLALPRHRERYLNLALALAGVCALAIDTARTHKRLVEADKMASLGILVAGVAHEIGTPLGICLTAASTLQAQVRQLAEALAGQTMTRSSLTGFLARADTEAALIREHLDRLGRLSASFREAALDGAALGRSRFRLKACFDALLPGLARLPRPADLEILNHCDPGLELDSFEGDWTTIFTNLVTNSLQHGFRGRDHGRIELASAIGQAGLEVDYRDDGVGLTEEARTRIFDPFFTTDLQHGLGLGMNLVFNLVSHRLGGTITCTSRPGEGLKIHIEAPL